MRTSRLPIAVLALAAALAGCATEKQWMKVGESYTTAEFRRDYADCSKTKNGKLDEDCLRSRGWVDMKPSKGDRAADTPAPPPANIRR
jgi:hypothetical protein